MNMNNTRTILATAYAINPYKGSEDGMGWNAIYQIARFQKVIAITRENNQPNIEKYMAENPDSVYRNIEFKYFDLPMWVRFWKKKTNAAMIYYWMWQKALPAYIMKQNIKCDIVHNLNFHNDWTPSYLHKLKLPFIWGPIGHHPQIPNQYLKPYNVKHLLKDKFTWLIKNIFWKYSTNLKQTISSANHIMCMNTSVAKVIPIDKNKISIIPSVATEDNGKKSYLRKDEFKLISVGRLVPLKGFDLTICAFSTFLNQLSENQKRHCELIIVGSGSEKQFLENLVQEKGITPYVKFIDWIERKKLLEMYNEVSAFLFPSHEGAGMVVAEALSYGLPVICLDNYGPGEFIDENCGFAVPQKDYDTTVKALSESISTIYNDPNLLKRMSTAARERYEGHFNWNKRGEQFRTIYKSILS